MFLSSRQQNVNVFFSHPGSSALGTLSMHVISNFSSAHLCEGGGCNKQERGNCGSPACLPDWTRDWGTKLKDRIREKIRIEIGGRLLWKELGQQTRPLSHLAKIAALLLPLSCLSKSTILGKTQYAANVLYSLTLLNHIQQPPLRGRIFTCWISSWGSLEMFLWLCVENGSEIMRRCWFWL